MWTILQSILLRLHVLWLQFVAVQSPLTQWLLSPRLLGCCVAVIGDGTALGMGDGRLFPGCCGQLSTLLNNSHILRHKWAVASIAKPFSSSSDWLHFLPPINTNAIAVLCIGSLDSNPITAFDNIRTITANLRSRFGFVYVCSVPNINPNSSAARLNELLLSWLSNNKNVKLAAQVDVSNIEYRRVYANSLLCSRGYVKMAKDIFLAIENDCRKIEFKMELRQLASQ